MYPCLQSILWTWGCFSFHHSSVDVRVYPIKKISEEEEKSFTSSLNIFPEAGWRKGAGGVMPSPPHPHPLSQHILLKTT
jgi:hypothetical protein